MTAHSRRGVLRGSVVAAGTVVGLSGCLGGGGSGTPTVTGSAPNLPTPVLGDPDAAVTVAAYEDFSCPHCATFNREVFPDVESTFIESGAIRYEHHDFPIPVDDWSWPVASAARAVQDGQGDGSFFDYAHRLFEHQGEFSLDLLAEQADVVGAAPGTVRAAAAEQTYRPVVAADREQGIDRGVSGTPTVFVNDQKFVAPDFAELRAAIEAAQ